MVALVMRFFTRSSLVLVLMTAAPLAMAYIGPGSGISVVGSLLGLLATILITIGAIALFPFRRMMRKRAQKQSSEDLEDDFSPESEKISLEPVESESVNSK
jgi:hypothetical protein